MIFLFHFQKNRYPISIPVATAFKFQSFFQKSRKSFAYPVHSDISITLNTYVDVFDKYEKQNNEIIEKYLIDNIYKSDN